MRAARHALVLASLAALSWSMVIVDDDWHTTVDRVTLRLHHTEFDADSLYAATALALAITDGNPLPENETLAAAAQQLRTETVGVICKGGKINNEVELDGLSPAFVIGLDPKDDGTEYCKRMTRSGEWGSVRQVARRHPMNRPVSC